MIRILPLNDEPKLTVRPYYKLVVTLGYGEHCNDTTTESWLEIDDAKAMKSESLTEKEMDDMSWMEIQDLAYCITQDEAEKIVKFFDELWERKNKDGYEVDHIIVNDGKDSFWWMEQGAMTYDEFEWFSKIYEKYQCPLFNPQIEHNWCGVRDVRIEYIDENGDVHRCEVV